MKWCINTSVRCTLGPRSMTFPPGRAFEVEELRLGLSQLKRGKAVGADLTSTELLQGLVQVEGGESHLLEWFNRILATQRIPQQWNEPVMVMLPPKLPKIFDL